MCYICTSNTAYKHYTLPVLSLCKCYSYIIPNRSQTIFNFKKIILHAPFLISTSVKTIRPLSLPVPIPAQRARKPSQMQQKTNSSHLPPPAGPTGVHPDAVPLILFSLAYASRVQTSFLCCCNPTVFAEFCSHPVRSILFLGYLITSDHFDVNFI